MTDLFCVQTNELAVPYAASVYGMHFQDNTRNGPGITELYVAAAQYNEKLKGGDEAALMRRFTENQDGFVCVRAKSLALSLVAFWSPTTLLPATLLQQYCTNVFPRIEHRLHPSRPFGQTS